MRFSSAFALVPSALVAACGGGPATDKVPEVPATSEAASAVPSAAPSAAPAATAAASAVPAHLARADARPTGYHEDSTESATKIVLKPLFTKKNKPAFPKSTAGDKECWGSIALSGDHKKDFDALIASCGTPTGLVEYAKPAEGHLHHDGDKRDSFTLELMSGICYRYFAVADDGITDLDILIETPAGVIVADDKQSSSVAIIEAGKPWCMTDAATYDFHVEVDGQGKGKYLFGVWAKPK